MQTKDFEQDNENNDYMSTERILALTDGIFAIAMTLLVLTIDVPNPHEVAAGAALRVYLVNLWPQFGNYFLSFFLLAVFWIGLHKSSHTIIRTDHRHLWINIGLLMFVCLVPFSSSLSGSYPSNVEAQLVFNGNMFIIGMFYLGNWTYATHKHRLVDASLSDSLIRGVTIKVSVFPVVAFCTLILALFIPAHASWFYLVIPTVMKRVYAYHQRHDDKNSNQ